VWDQEFGTRTLHMMFWRFLLRNAQRAARQALQCTREPAKSCLPCRLEQ
jgi:hypothetical protein